MSTHPTAPHRLIAGSGCQHSLSEEQHLSPDGTASKHASTAALSSALVGDVHYTQPSVSTRSVHDVTPSSTYPASHVGTQDVPLTRVSVQLPTCAVDGRIGRVARVVYARPPADRGGCRHRRP